MKILHVYKDFDPPIHGGIERHIALMCRFQRQWAEVSALVCSRSPRTRQRTHEGVPIQEVGEWGRVLSVPLSPGFPWRLARARADVVVIHSPNPTAEVGWLLARSRRTMIVRYHSDIVRQARALRVYRPVQARFLNSAAMILPTSQPYLDTSATLQPVKDKCRVVPLGIVPEDFAAPAAGAVEALRQQYGGEFVFFCGMHRYYKGLQYLVEAAPRLRASIVIAGEGPQREQMMALAKQTGGRIHFPGRISDQELVAHLHACALVAFPSVERSEAFGVSIMEAHACGKAVVATRLGTGVEFINLDGQTGLNVAPRDSAALADGLNSLLDAPERREAMGAFARRRIVEEFSAERIARLELDLYEEAHARASGSRQV